MTAKVNLANLRAKLAQLKGSAFKSMDEKYLTIPVYDASKIDRSTIRILPGPVDNPDKFYVETILHRINNKNIHSPRILKKPCPLQAYIKTLWDSKNDANIAIAREIKGKKRYYFNAIIRERVVQNPDTGQEEVRKNDGPLIFSCGVKLFEKLIKTMLDEDYEDFLDLKQGYDYRVIREDQGQYPNYDDSKPAKKPSPAGTDEEIARWMSNLHDLDALINIPSNEEIIQEIETFKASLNSDNAKVAAVANAVVSSSDETDNDEDGEDFIAKLRAINAKK